MSTSEWKEWIVAVIVIGIFGLIIGLILPSAIDRSEVVNCLKLKAYSEQFSEFYLTERESEMCDRQKIEIDAPVR